MNQYSPPATAETPRLIGLLGGVGPAAGLDLAAKILAHTEAGSDQEHLPFILASLPGTIGDRTAFLLGQDPVNPAGALIEVLERLKAAGATIFGLPCNTAHGRPIFGPLEERVAAWGPGHELVNMLEETARHLALRPAGPLAVLSTLGTYLTRVYDPYLENQGLEALDPGRGLIEEIHQIIYHPGYGLKSRSGPVTSRARAELEDILLRLRSRGAKTVVLGCTELPLAFGENEFAGLELVDPTTVLARALIRRAAPAKLKIPAE